MTVLLVAAGGAAGAVLRHLVDRLARAHPLGGLPWGTLAVNVAGSFVLGALVGAAVPEPAAALLGTGVCGALTTYSSFAHQIVELARRRRWAPAAGYAVGSVLAGMAAASLGLALGRALLPGP